MTNKKFELIENANAIGFAEHYRLNPIKSIIDTLPRRRLYNRANDVGSDNSALRRIIERTASLRVGFGWSFEDHTKFTEMMLECIKVASENHAVGMNGVVADMTCEWFGFKPYNVFERVVFEDLTTHGLIIFNNELINYQISVLTLIQCHPLYLGHAFLRDDQYRFDFFKSIRNNPEKLLDTFHYFISTINNISGIKTIPRSLVEEMIGCHYLHYPDIFFEALGFHLLSGKIYEQ